MASAVGIDAAFPFINGDIDEAAIPEILDISAIDSYSDFAIFFKSFFGTAF